MIKVVTGSSAPTGATIALVDLCREFSERGYQSILYGPDYWHLDKCRSGKLAEFRSEPGDIVLVQNLPLWSMDDLDRLDERVLAWKKNGRAKGIAERIRRVLSSAPKNRDVRLILIHRENDFFGLRQFDLNLFDGICSSDYRGQKRYGKKHPFWVCPHFCQALTPGENKPRHVAGVIGSVRKENNTHLAVERALADEMVRVVIYGYLADPIYYYQAIEPIARKHPGQVQFAGFVDNRQAVYDSLSDVYVAADKPWSTVKRECFLTRTHYHGPDNTEPAQWLENDRIFDLWKLNLFP